MEKYFVSHSHLGQETIPQLCFMVICLLVLFYISVSLLHFLFGGKRDSFNLLSAR